MTEKTPPPISNEARKMNWLEKQFANTPIFIVCIAGFFFAPIMFILSIIGLLVSKDPIARRNASIIFFVDLVLFGIVVLRILVAMSQ